MSSFPQSAHPARGGFVLVAPDTGRPLKTIPFQYNPDTLTRTMQPQGIGDEPGDRLEALRLTGPAHETLKFDAEFDATDAPANYPDGLYPVLSTLELSITPSTAQLQRENRLASGGQLEIAPAEASLTVLVLGTKRVLPVRITEFSFTEEAFDRTLNPIRAKVSVGARLLTVDDLGFRHKGGLLYLTYHQHRERFAAGVNTPLATLGVTTI